MKINWTLCNWALIVLIPAAVNTARAQTTNPAVATAQAFSNDVARARAALERDNGHLWGARLDSVAWIGVDGETILLSAAPTDTGYTTSDGRWEGPLPTTVTPSNSSVNWNGRTWAMILLPTPPGDSLMIERLFIHEAMHVLQPSVLPAPPYNETGTGSAALDEPVGRKLASARTEGAGHSIAREWSGSR